MRAAPPSPSSRPRSLSSSLCFSPIPYSRNLPRNMLQLVCFIDVVIGHGSFVRHLRQVMNVTRDLEEARDQNHEMSTNLNILTIEKHSMANKFEDLVCDYKSALTDHTALTDKCEALIQENAALTKKLQSLEQKDRR